MENIEKELFLQALDFPDDQQASFINAAAPSPGIAARVLALLSARRSDSKDVVDDLRQSIALTEADEVLSFTTLQHPHYRFDRKIGYGGFSEVFEGERLHPFQQVVALKVLLNTPQYQELFLQEANILGSLQHPHIAQVYDVGQLSDGRYFLVMELIKGKPILAYSDEKQLSVRERLMLFRSLCAAVSFAHQNLIIHRDLKPNNVLVTDDGVVKLLDFGVSKILREAQDENQTQTGLIAFTPAYAAPEQLQRKPVGMAADVYALGALGYQLLVGKLPYQIPKDASPVVVEEIVTTSRILPLSQHFRNPTEEQKTILANRKQTRSSLYKQFLGDLDAVLLKALAKDPKERYRSAGALMDELDRFLNGSPVLAQPSSRVYLFKKFVLRNKWLVGSATVALIMFITTLAILSWQNHKVMEANVRAEVESQKNKAVIKFMTGLLLNGSAEITGQSVDTLRFKSVIQQGTKDLLENKNKNPRAYAEMSHVFGMLYDNWGNKEKALSLFQEAYMACKTHQFIDIPCEFDLPSRIAIILTKKGQIGKAVSIYEQLAQKRPEELSNNMTYAVFLHNTGALKTLMGDYREAEHFFNNVLQLRSQLPAKDINTLRTIASSQTYLGRIYENTGRYDEAATTYETAYQGLFGEKRVRNTAFQPKMLQIMMAAHHGQIHKHLEAMKSLIGWQEKQALNSKESFVPLYHRLGVLQEDAGLQNEAVATWQKAYEIERALHGERSTESMTLRLRLIHAALEKGATSVQEREILKISTEGSSYVDTHVLAKQVLGRLYLESGKVHQAIAVLDEVLALQNRVWTVPTRAKARTLFYLAQAHLKNGQAIVARRYSNAALSSYNQTVGKEHRDYKAVWGFQRQLP
ncbi:MAG TPA: serine/threonine-protein kinase [Rhodothermales bacterium]|nr:serine/threonine-protein kinase [Rhodothermales bacterium]